ncbi:hypothetical protein CD113_06320 [Staphylococcus simiae]|uniref:Uncharacterized protein n=1 Tax=Staphylococcus simiae CCM 7213 = CCUG 51256 TaxID=911238 RepID=G5JH67_9STAP|nr:hypothetical protein SS7213T_03980 [Staphylococcus simiae CCM 7213 = CCUG 51256]PNZ12627.1 hypothetical protein CD113_06320 [Staphylococcus simiae]SNV67152.1 Uncharacterised protein [Staphylococcus simiae]
MRPLNDTIKQKYRHDTQGKSLSQIERELRAKGINCFVISASGRKVTAIVSKVDKMKNRECLK